MVTTKTPSRPRPRTRRAAAAPTATRTRYTDPAITVLHDLPPAPEPEPAPEPAPDPLAQRVSVDLYLGHEAPVDAPILRTTLPISSIIRILLGTGWVEIPMGSEPAHPYGESRLMAVGFIAEIRLVGAFPPALREWLVNTGWNYVTLLQPLA